MDRRTHRRTGAVIAAAIVALLLAALTTTSGAGAQAAPEASLTPAAVTAAVMAGGSVDIAKTAQTPELPSNLDVYLLADSTGSMGAYLDAVHLSSEVMFASITAQAPGAQFGVGQYEDFTAEGPCNITFDNQTPITADSTTVGDAINAWSAGGGCDAPESQLYALDRLTDPSNPGGFRSASAKAIVMFGDAPAHDPVCAALTGLDHDVTEASVTARLQAAGITLIVVSVDGGMDGDPTASAGDYQPTCPTIGGAPGQGSRMAAATGGTYTTITDAAELVPAVLAAVQAVNVEVSLRADCPAPLQVTFTPAMRTVVSGAAAEFTETFSAPADAASATISCTTSMLINGEPVAGAVETNEITIEGQAPRYTG